MRQGNKNTIVGTQNVGDANLTGNIQYLNNGSIRFKQGVGNATTNLEINQGVAFRNSFKSSNVISNINGFFGSLNNVFNNFSFSCDSILFWVVKKNYSYKELVQYGSTGSFLGNSILPNLFSDISGLITNTWSSAIAGLGPAGDILSGIGGGGGGSQVNLSSFYDVTSDSIGVMANSKYLQLDTTLPIFDITQETYGVPIPFAASSENKISPTTRNVMYDLSRMNTAVMRRNLVGVAYGNTTLRMNMAADATVPHGVNLINDLPTFTKINTQLSTLVSRMGGVIPGFKLFQYVCYLSNIGNKTGFNLRDDRPVLSSDRDFVVVTSEQRAQGAIDQINEIAALSEARALIQRMAQSFPLQQAFIRSGGSVITPTGSGPVGGVEGAEEPLDPFPEPPLPDDAPFVIEEPIIDPETGEVTGYELIWSGGEFDGQPLNRFERDIYLREKEQGILNGLSDFDAGEAANAAVQEYWLLQRIQLGLPPSGGNTGQQNIDTSNTGAGLGPATIGLDYGVTENTRTEEGSYSAFGARQVALDYNSGSATSRIGIVVPRDATAYELLVARHYVNSVKAWYEAQGISRELENGTGIITRTWQGYTPTRFHTEPFFYQDLAAANAVKNNVSVKINGNDVTYTSILANTLGTLPGVKFIAPHESGIDGGAPGYPDQGIPNERDFARQFIIPGLQRLKSGSQPQSTTASSNNNETPSTVDENGVIDPLPDINSTPPSSTIGSAVGTPSNSSGTSNLGAITIPTPGYQTPATTDTESEETPSEFFNRMGELLNGFSGSDYSNRQLSRPYTFYVTVEGVLQEVDYLMKSVIRTGFSVCKTINQRLRVTQKVERPTRTSDANLISNQAATILGLPADSPYIQTGSQLIQGILTNQNINNILFSTANDALGGIVSSAQSNPAFQTIQGYFDGAVGAVNELGPLFDATGGLLPTTGDLINVLNPVTFLQDLNIPPLLPSINLGSIGDLLSLASNIGSNGVPTSLGGFLQLQEQIYTIICNFDLPNIIEDLELWYQQWKDFVDGFDYKEIDDKLIGLITLFIDRILERFDIIRLIKSAIKNGLNLWENLKKEFWDRFFSCERYKQQDKSGVNSPGGQGGPPGII